MLVRLGFQGKIERAKERITLDITPDVPWGSGKPVSVFVLVVVVVPVAVVVLIVVFVVFVAVDGDGDEGQARGATGVGWSFSSPSACCLADGGVADEAITQNESADRLTAEGEDLTLFWLSAGRILSTFTFSFASAVPFRPETTCFSSCSLELSQFFAPLLGDLGIGHQRRFSLAIAVSKCLLISRLASADQLGMSFGILGMLTPLAHDAVGHGAMLLCLLSASTAAHGRWLPRKNESFETSNQKVKGNSSSCLVRDLS